MQSLASPLEIKRLPGQYYDAETNLHYNHFRYYDPSLGKYISANPMGAIPSLSSLPIMNLLNISIYYNHSYSYVDENPIALFVVKAC